MKETATFLAINRKWLFSETVLSCVIDLDKVGARNTLNLQWIKAYFDLEGIKRACVLANRGLWARQQGPNSTYLSQRATKNWPQLKCTNGLSGCSLIYPSVDKPNTGF